MDSDHGARAESEKKIAWPTAASHHEVPPDTSPDAAVEPGPGPYGPGCTPRDAEDAVLGPGTFTDGRDEPVTDGADETATDGVGSGMAALSLRYQVVAAVALSIIGLVTCGHLAMVFLHVAPSNTLTKQHGEAIDDWVYPEFEQNWKLFAPNPLQQNISVEVRAEVAGADGGRTTRWMNLSREDGEAIRGNPLPSHVDQNELRRGWDFYINSHDGENRATGLRGELSEQYIRRIVMLRLAERDHGGTVERIQVRSAVRAVGVPPWSDEEVSTKPDYRVLPWWNVTSADLPVDKASGPAQASRSEGAGR